MTTAAEIKEGKGLNQLSLGLLAKAYEQNRSSWPKKTAAEVAFALAIGIKEASDAMGERFKDKKDTYALTAKMYAKECLAILSGLPANTLDDVAPVHTSLAGVTMPNYLYMEYVQRRLRDRGLVS